jgi:hypothetical protein
MHRQPGLGLSLSYVHSFGLSIGGTNLSVLTNFRTNLIGMACDGLTSVSLASQPLPVGELAFGIS